MYDNLLALPIGAMVSLDHKKIVSFFNEKDFTILDVAEYDYDNDKIAILELDQCYLIITDALEEPQYYAAEYYDSGDEFMGHNEFLSTITIRMDGSKAIYKLQNSVISDSEFEVPSIAEYLSANSTFFNILFVQHFSNKTMCYRAFSIEERDIII